MNGRLSQPAEGPGCEAVRLTAAAKDLAMRKASGKVLAATAQQVPWLMGGAADRAPSTKTALDSAGAPRLDQHVRRRATHQPVEQLASFRAMPGRVLLLATGSEVALCIGAFEQLTREGVGARVVSMPSWHLFETQSAEYRDSALPPAVAARVSVEAASPLGWECHVGQRGTIIGMRSFGIFAPGKVAEVHFGFDVAQIVAAAKAQLVRHAPMDRGRS